MLTWLDPAGPAVEDSLEAEAELILDGRFVQLRYCGRLGETPVAGQLLIGYHVGDRQVEAAWMDSFHNGSAMMACTGHVEEDGTFVVLGSYPDGNDGPRWGWRMRLGRAGDLLVLDAENIHPDGTADRAVWVSGCLTEWQRVG